MGAVNIPCENGDAEATASTVPGACDRLDVAARLVPAKGGNPEPSRTPSLARPEYTAAIGSGSDLWLFKPAVSVTDGSLESLPPSHAELKLLPGQKSQRQMLPKEKWRIWLRTSFGEAVRFGLPRNVWEELVNPR